MTSPVPWRRPDLTIIDFINRGKNQKTPSLGSVDLKTGQIKDLPKLIMTKEFSNWMYTIEQVTGDIEGVTDLAGTGILVKTAAASYAVRAVESGNPDRILIGNGNGILANIVVDIPDDLIVNTVTGYRHHILSTGANFDVILRVLEVLTADRYLTIQLGNANRTLILTGTASIEGTNTGDQTISLTGDVTGSGTGTFAATISPTVLTAAGRALIDDATASAQRVTLGINRVSTFTQFDKTDITLTDITGLSVNVAAGATYTFRAVLFVNPDAVGGSRYSIAGTATATSIVYHVSLLDDTTDAYTIAVRETALGANNAAQAGTTLGKCMIDGLIAVNQAGTLTVQFAQHNANGTSSVIAGWLEVHAV